MKNLKKFEEFINENELTKSEIIKKFGEQEGNYLSIEPVENGLYLHITKEGREEAEENKDDEKKKLSDMNLWDYFEDIQVNSEWMYHFDMGEAGFGLTNAPGFTYGYHVADNGDITNKDQEENSEVYWFPNYMVEDFCETLLEEGKVFFYKGMKYLKTFEEYDKYDPSKFIHMVGTDRDETIPVGNFVIFNYFPSDFGYHKPYRYVGEVIENSKFNRVKVKVTDYIFKAIDSEGENQVRTDYNSSKSSYKIGDEVEVHYGNIINKSYPYPEYKKQS